MVAARSEDGRVHFRPRVAKSKEPILYVLPKPPSPGEQPKPIPLIPIKMLITNEPVIAVSYSGGNKAKPLPSWEFETTEADRQRVKEEFNALYKAWRAANPQAAAEIDRHAHVAE